MNAKEIRGKKIQFGMWLGFPEGARTPKTQDELAKEMELTPQCLTRWKKDPLVQEVSENAIKLKATGHTVTIIDEMIKKAEEGNVNAAKLVLDYTGQLKSKPLSREAPKEIRISFVNASTDQSACEAVKAD